MDNLTTKQKEFIDLAIAGKNIFLTGKAGTGKSFVTKHLMEIFSKKGVKFVCVAPTGIAASNIGGQTIHSMFSITPFGIIDFDSCKYIKSERRRLFEKIDVIIFDEMSMVRPDILDAVHWTLKKNMCNGLDKKQVIFVGDMKQLEPVLSDNDRSVLLQTYDGVSFDFAKIYKSLEIKNISLDEVVRQNDEEFIKNLNIIREGKKSSYFKRFVATEPKGIILAPYNSKVAEYNKKGLDKINLKPIVFDAVVTGNVKADEFNIESRIIVKNGCSIMYMINSKENPLVNGSIGIFTSHNNCHYIRINNTDFSLTPYSFTKKEYVYDKLQDKIVMKEIGTISQYPIKLAYALSIHKSQGLTFDEVTVDLSRPCFTKSQIYVALSRVRTPEGLRIII